jgi:hypothetical protein
LEPSATVHDTRFTKDRRSDTPIPADAVDGANGDGAPFFRTVPVFGSVMAIFLPRRTPAGPWECLSAHAQSAKKCLKPRRLRQHSKRKNGHPVTKCQDFSLFRLY